MAAPAVAAIGAGIAAGGSIIGGIMGQEAQKEINEKNLAFAKQQWKENVALQKEFAQNSIAWRVADARKAGIHPLAALGTQSAYYTPQSYNGYESNDNSLGQSIASAGAHVGQALNTISLQMAEAELEEKRANAALKQMEVAKKLGQAQGTAADDAALKIAKSNQQIGKIKELEITSGLGKSQLSGSNTAKFETNYTYNQHSGVHTKNVTPDDNAHYEDLGFFGATADNIKESYQAHKYVKELRAQGKDVILGYSGYPPRLAPVDRDKATPLDKAINAYAEEGLFGAIINRLPSWDKKFRDSIQSGIKKLKRFGR